MNKTLISLIFVVLFVMGSCDKELDWLDQAPDKMTWNEAVAYCENLGGRLPTISELRTLIQNCPATETGGECGVTDSCLSYDDCRNNACVGCMYDESGKYSVFGDTQELWSSSERSDGVGGAWFVGFLDGRVGFNFKSNSPSVRCVQ